MYCEGKYSEAESQYREALAINRRALGERHPKVALCLRNIGQALSGQRRHDEAERVLKEALALDRSALGRDHPAVAKSLTYLAESQCRSGKALEAERSAREALTINIARLGNEHPQTKESEGALGCALVKLSRVAEAEPFLLSQVAALEGDRGAQVEYPDAVQQIIDMYTAWGKPDKAAEWRAKLPKAAAPLPVK